MPSRFWSKLRWKLCLPEYLFRPAQIFRKVKRKVFRKSVGPNAVETALLPWGLNLRITAPELIQNAVWFKGVYDIVASETIWRLLDEGETCLDIGAHIGYMTSIMAARVRNKGRVISFEPHPTLFQELQANTEQWGGDIGEVCIWNLALSDGTGTAVLELPSDWARNRGVARLGGGLDSAHGGGTSCPVPVARLDDVLDQHAQLGLVKVDVEGHEMAVLRGAESFLRRRAIRDIVFEELGTYPTPPMRYLESFGYSLYSLAKYFRGPRLCNPDRRDASPRDDPNYLATINPERAEKRFHEKGWFVLRERDPGRQDPCSITRL